MWLHFIIFHHLKMKQRVFKSIAFNKSVDDQTGKSRTMAAHPKYLSSGLKPTLQYQPIPPQPTALQFSRN
ncbi:hypothetical protein HanPI659440_Chr17g0663321 [Helianthus annuus]|nr:hypothetical protein HanPI659440_Chr17g0663321 [Helianthus annuus]